MIKHPHQNSLEVLEPRVAPASIQGIVIGGTLKLTALSAATAVNASLVQFDADSFDLLDSGVPGAIRFDGVKNIQAVLSGVDDSFTISLADPANRGSISILSGTGTDAVTLSGLGSTWGDLTITSEGAAQVQLASSLAFKGKTKISVADGTVISGATLGDLTVTGPNFMSLTGIIAGNVKVIGPDTGLQVNASATIHGNLTVAGGTGVDSLALTGKTDGKIRFAPGEGGSSFSVSGLFAAGNSVTVVGGALSPDTVNLQLTTFDPFVTSISGQVNLALGGGNNQVSITGNGRFGSSLRVSAGDGNDTLTMNGFLSVAGSTQLALGGGTNTTDIIAAILHGGLKYAGGAGVDDLGFENADVLGAAKIALGEGANVVQAVVTAFDNGLLVKGGAGTDNVSVAAVTVFGKATLMLGDGTNSFQAVVSGLRGGFAYQGGSGNDTITLGSDNILLGTGLVKPGTGNNVMFATTLSLLTSFTYAGDSGSDFFSLESAGGTFARIKVLLGDGNDTAFVQTSNFHSIRLDGGAGVDTLDRTNAAVSAGLIATLFENVNTI